VDSRTVVVNQTIFIIDDDAFDVIANMIVLEILTNANKSSKR